MGLSRTRIEEGGGGGLLLQLLLLENMDTAKEDKRGP